MATTSETRCNCWKQSAVMAMARLRLKDAFGAEATSSIAMMSSRVKGFLGIEGSETADLQPEDVEVGRAAIDLASDAALTALDAVDLARDAVNLANDGVVEALDEVDLVPVQTGVTAKFSGLIFS
jgi:hypothetical protein